MSGLQPPLLTGGLAVLNLAKLPKIVTRVLNAEPRELGSIEVIDGVSAQSYWY